MFPLGFWCQRFFPGRYWPKIGAEAAAAPGEPIRMTYSIPGPVVMAYTVPAAVTMTYDMNGG